MQHSFHLLALQMLQELSLLLIITGFLGVANRNRVLLPGVTYLLHRDSRWPMLLKT